MTNLRDLGLPLEQPDSSPCADVIEEEMRARGWTVEDVARRMGPASDYGINHLCVDMFLACRRERNIVMDDELAGKLGRAFGVSPQFFVRLHNDWRAAQ